MGRAFQDAPLAISILKSNMKHVFLKQKLLYIEIPPI